MASAKDPALKCIIKNVEPDPLHGGRTIVSVQFDDGKGDPWIQGFSLTTPDHPITLEELVVSLQEQHIERPKDPFAYIKEAQQNKTSFALIVTDVGSSKSA